MKTVKTNNNKRRKRERIRPRELDHELTMSNKSDYYPWRHANCILT